MMAFLNSLIIQTLGIALATSLLEILKKRILIIIGFTKENTIWLRSTLFLLVIFFRLAYPDSKMDLYILLAIVGTLSMNRYEFTVTIKHERWWWKKENLSTDQD